MEKILTKQDILDLFAAQAKNFDNLILKEREEREKSIAEEEKERKKSMAQFNKMLGELGGTWGKFVQEMVRPRIIDLFQEKGIEIEVCAQNVIGRKGKEKFYEIDLLLMDTTVSIAVEIKSSLSKADVDEHLERLEKIRTVNPKPFNLSGMTIYGAVAGIIIEEDADKYAYRKGLFVLRQKGNIVEIVNDKKFVPKQWIVEY